MKSKKGFMSISIIYSFLILFLVIMFSILISYSNRLNMITSLTKEAREEIKENGSAKSLSLYVKLLIDNAVQSDEILDFSNTIGEGLFYTEDSATYGEDGERIYYFRGNVSNNWVNFAGYLWRIVRTTSEGGVKLVYSGDGNQNTSGFIDSSAFNTTSNSKYYVGYTYNSSLNGYVGTQTNSSIKTKVDTWYNTYLNSYANYLSTTAIYCADRNVEAGTSPIYYPAYERITVNRRPTFACLSTNSSRYTVSATPGNAYLQKPIALLTADEIIYAGVTYNTGSSNSYIKDNAKDYGWWTMTPYGYNGTNALIFVTGVNYLENASGSTSSYRIRPTVSLKPCVSHVSGNGTKASPYVISNSSCS